LQQFDICLPFIAATLKSMVLRSPKDVLDWIIFIGCLSCTSLAVCIVIIVNVDLFDGLVCYASKDVQILTSCHSLTVLGLFTSISCVLLAVFYCFSLRNSRYVGNLVLYGLNVLIWTIAAGLSHKILGLTTRETSSRTSKIWIRNMMWSISAISFLTSLLIGWLLLKMRNQNSSIVKQDIENQIKNAEGIEAA
jgi:hypothetical protein